jgi:effector-binding domain-containing protein
MNFSCFPRRKPDRFLIFHRRFLWHISLYCSAEISGMKKLFFVLLILTSLVLVASYTLIPSVIRISARKPVSTTVATINTLLLQEHGWERWWPGSITGDSGFSFKDYSFHVTRKTINSIELTIANNKSDLPGILVIAPVENDSIVLDWHHLTRAGTNPLKRISTYFKAKQTEKVLNSILEQIKIKSEDNEFVYGIRIQKEKVTDTLLITTKLPSAAYPSTEETYQLIGRLESLISSQHVKAINPPMLHIQKIDSAFYQTMVALPIRQWVTPEKNTVVKRMVMGNILTTEITGGPSAIRNAYKQMQQYILDHNMSQPAIPYESLITNRIQTRDTAKWVTKLYFPVY